MTTPPEIRAQVDAMAPRVLPDGRINTQHVAIEQTLRQRHALPSYVPELDGPGQFVPHPLPSTEELLDSIRVDLRAGNMTGVAAGIRVLAVVDPRAAQTILDVLELPR